MDATVTVGPAPQDGVDAAVHTAETARIRLWDLPLRIFHWSLVVAVGVAIVSGELGGPWMDVHGKAGLSIAGLVVFRLVWGVVGSVHARFAHFVPTPRSIHAYVTGRWRGAGHNPLGALSVFALLGLLAVQATTGLFSFDDIAFNGPLFALVDEAVAGKLTALHRQGATVLFVLLALHVVAIVFYAWVKRDNLVKPMLTGWKHVAVQEAPAPQTNPAARKPGGGPVALVIALATACAVVYGVSGAGIS